MKRTRSTDILAVGSLLTDGIIGVTDIVEALHQTIRGQAWAVGAPDHLRVNGVSGLVYWTIRTVSRRVARLSESLIDATDEQPSSPRRDAMLAWLNGVFGDHIVAQNNPLAIEMQVRWDGKRLDETALKEIIAQSDGRIALMVHGSCKTDLQWGEYGHDHGAALAADLGITPIYLFYNSGLHVSQNGRALAQLLETVMTLSPKPLQLFIIAHSMGGLVTRSACHYAEQSDKKWLTHLQKVFFLGTPHHGAPLERSGNWVDLLLTFNPYSAPFARLGKIRSSGVTDLRYGNVVDEDWQGRDRFEMMGDPRTVVPLPADVTCYAIAGSLAKGSNKFVDDVVGDGLVPVRSALGLHKRAEMTLAIEEDHRWLGRNINHRQLLTDPEVYAKLKAWLAD